MGGPSDEDSIPRNAPFHRLPWHDFDAFGRLEAGPAMVRHLRRTERSRRKLLLFGLMEKFAKNPEWFGPLPTADAAWELLARVEDRSPKSLDSLLVHPYTGSWAGYTTRLVRNGIDGACPLWVHVGYVHAIAAAAAIKAGIDFRIEVPVWNGDAMLPAIGSVRLTTSSPFSTAAVTGIADRYTVGNDNGSVPLPPALDDDAENWLHVRRVRTRVGPHRFSVRLDDLDPYRGLYEPVPPRRLPAAEVAQWQQHIDAACQLIVEHMPDFAEIMPIGLVSLVPAPQVPYQNPSASTTEAFGSALVGRPTDGAALAATLIHEFQHIVLGSLLHMIRIHEDDPRERFYVPWRDDPRPLSGTMQGLYAFTAVTKFWRSLARPGTEGMARRAAFEFALWRDHTWRVLGAVRHDHALTAAGRRLLDWLASQLRRWRADPVPDDVAELAATVAADHRAGWRTRYVRPDARLVSKLVAAWEAAEPRPPLAMAEQGPPPTPVPDGSWSRARADLIRIGMSEPVPGIATSGAGATPADVAFATGRFDEAADGYRNELGLDPDRPTSLVGLGLALSARGPSDAGRALLNRPELVRAVHRALRHTGADVPTPERLAAWLGQLVSR